MRLKVVKKMIQPNYYFIWSGFEKYLRYETDSYILFSPVKYFKSQI